MMHKKGCKVVAVFAGSKSGIAEQYSQEAEALGQFLGQAGVDIRCGGGASGLMGRLVTSAIASGGCVIGVTTKNACQEEVLAPDITHALYAKSLGERKDMIIHGVDAIIALPGGVGVVDEIFHVWALGRLRLLESPLFLVNPMGYFDHLLGLRHIMRQEGFLGNKGYSPVFGSLREAIALISRKNE